MEFLDVDFVLGSEKQVTERSEVTCGDVTELANTIDWSQ